ncbi:MAG: acyl-CoA dehydrogenase family protein [Mycobacterium sp.]
MITDLGDEAKEYGRQALRAFEAAGGDALVQQAEADPAARAALVDPVLSDLGVWELEPREDADQLEAAAALCRSTGYWALPYPVAERLSRTADDDGLVVVADTRPVGAVAGVDVRWGAVTLDGRRSTAVATGDPERAFVTRLALTPIIGSGSPDGTADLPLALVLPCWTLLGMLDRAMELTIAHVRLRQQFGQPLSAFQSVQFQLTDGEVERAGLEMLAKYATWSLTTGGDDALNDALALRMAALEAAEIVFRVTHQLHGAVGFCDETTLSWLSRYSQPLRRLPLGLSATRTRLTDRLGSHGLSGLYGDAREVVS